MCAAPYYFPLRKKSLSIYLTDIAETSCSSRLGFSRNQLRSGKLLL